MALSPEATAPERANGLTTYLSVLTAPRAAFETLARVPMWGWAAIIGFVLTVVGAIIGLPATLHMVQISQQQQLSQMPADQQVQAEHAMAQFAPLMKYFILGGTAVVPWIVWLIEAVIFLIAAALGGGVAKFKPAWVAAVNAYVISALTQIVQAFIVRLRPLDTISSQSDLYVIPSLTMLVHGGPKLEAFLYSYNILYVWFYVIVVIALEQVLKVNRTAAIIAVAILSLVFAGLGTLGAR